jgi:hypothetical protein
MPSLFGVGTLLYKTAPSAKIVLMKHVSNARPIRCLTDRLAWFLGVPATTPITLIASADGLVKRKIHVRYAKRPGLL